MTLSTGRVSITVAANHAAGVSNTHWLTSMLSSLCCSAGSTSVGVVPLTLKEAKKQEEEEDETHLEEDF